MNKLGVISEYSSHSHRASSAGKPKIIDCAELESKLLNRKHSNSSNDINQPSEPQNRALPFAKSSPNLHRRNSMSSLPTNVAIEQQLTPVQTSSQSRINMVQLGTMSVPARAPVSLIAPNVISKSGGATAAGKGRGAIKNALVNNQKISIAGNIYAFYSFFSRLCQQLNN